LISENVHLRGKRKDPDERKKRATGRKNHRSLQSTVGSILQLK
jgi:hypothetical protein